MKIAEPGWWAGFGGVLFLTASWFYFGRESSEFPASPAHASAGEKSPTKIEVPRRREQEIPVEKPAAVDARGELSLFDTQGTHSVKMMRNAGRSSVRAALETELYALGGGDIDLLASVITFDLSERSEITSLLSAVPIEIRKQYQTPERIVAFLFMGGQRMETLAILAETSPLDGVVVNRVQYKFYDDPTIRDESMVFSQDTGGWKSVVPVGLIRRITRPIKSPSPE